MTELNIFTRTQWTIFQYFFFLMLLPSLLHIPHSLWGIFWQLGEHKMFIPFCPIFKTALSQLHSQLWPLQIIEWTSPQNWFTEIPLLLLAPQNLSITAETSKDKSVRALHVLSFIITCIWTPSSSSHGYSFTKRLWAFWRNSSICLKKGE